MDFTTKDSGVRVDFETGAHRDSQDNKGRYDLIPPEGMKRLAQLLERGAGKYGDRNWELGMPMSRLASSMLRHAFQAAAGAVDEDHLAAVCFNAMALIVHQERIANGELDADLDDLPHRPTPATKPMFSEEIERLFPRSQAVPVGSHYGNVQVDATWQQAFTRLAGETPQRFDQPLAVGDRVRITYPYGDWTDKTGTVNKVGGCILVDLDDGRRGGFDRDELVRL